MRSNDKTPETPRRDRLGQVDPRPGRNPGYAETQPPDAATVKKLKTPKPTHESK